MTVGILDLQIQIAGCKSLKEKRSHIRPMIHRIRREFNVSIAETDLQDKWDDCCLTVSAAGNDPRFIQKILNQVEIYISHNYPDLEIIHNRIEII